MIYLDNNATTRVYEDVVNAMTPYFSDIYYNPSSNDASSNSICTRSTTSSAPSKQAALAALANTLPGAFKIYSTRNGAFKTIPLSTMFKR